MGKDNKSIGVSIQGWNMFFLFQLGLCAIIFVMSFNSGFSSLNYYYGIEYVCDIISIIFIAIYAILVIRAFIKRRAFAIQLARAYLFALFLDANCDLLGIILDCNTDKFLICIIGMMWFAVWFMYLLFSRKLEELFPTSARVSRKKDYLPIVFIVCPQIVLLVLIVG